MSETDDARPAAARRRRPARRSRASRARASRARRTSGSLQGEGVFFDDVKRHGMGYVALRPLAVRAREDHVDRRLEGARARRRLRHADRRRGRDPHRSVLRAVGQAGRRHQGLRARGRHACATWASRSPRSSRRRASSRATRPSSSRSSTSRCPRSTTREDALTQRDDPPRRRRLERRLGGRLRLGRLRGRGRRGRPRREDRAAALRPLLVDAARVRRRPRRVQPRHRAVDDVRQPPDARASARSGWRRRCAPGSTSCASSRRTSAAPSATRSACTRSTSRAACSRAS